MEKYFYLRTYVRLSAIDLDSQDDDGENAGHMQKLLAYVKRHIGGSERDCDFNEGVVEDVREPEDGHLAHDEAKSRPTQDNTYKIDSNLTS